MDRIAPWLVGPPERARYSVSWVASPESLSWNSAMRLRLAEK